MTEPLTPVQEVMLLQYHLARIAWESDDGGTEESANAYSASVDACYVAGFDPFHYPQPQ